MNWPLIRILGIRYSVAAAGTTAGLAYAAAAMTAIEEGLLALGLVGVTAVVLVVALGTSGASTAAAGNSPGGTTVVSPADVGAGVTPPGGLRALFYALGLLGWVVLWLLVSVVTGG